VPAAHDPSQPPSRAEQAQAVLFERLGWRIAERDERAVIEQAIRTGEIDAIYGLEEGAALDRFWGFISWLGVDKLLASIKGEGIKRVMVSMVQFVVLYLLKTVYGVPSVEALPALLFCSEAAMRLAGFNGHQVSDGVSQRSQYKRKPGDKRIGPVSVDAIRENLGKIAPAELERVFNDTIKALAKRRMFPKTCCASLDTSLLEVGPSFEGAGVTSRRERKNRTVGGEVVTITHRIRGFKVGAIMEISLRIPIAVVIETAEFSDVNMTRRLVQQARENLGEHGELERLVFDRGFLDGADLAWLTEQEILFVIPAKKEMHVYADAVGLATLTPGERATRTEKASRRRRLSSENPMVEVHAVGLHGLTSYSEYGTDVKSSAANSKKFKPTPINAVVITESGKCAREEPLVLLTNSSVREPFYTLDAYWERATIENCLFREGKQSLHLEHPFQRNADAMKVHVFFTLLVLALCRAFRAFEAKDDQRQERGLPSTLEQFRRRLKAETANKIIVFAAGKFGIFPVAEWTILCGFGVREAGLKGIGDRASILAKYGIASGP